MTVSPPLAGRVVLYARTAADLMSSNPISIRAEVTVGEATAILMDRGYSAAPVIDDAGHPIGVISRADILVHDRERMTHPSAGGERLLPDGFGLEEVDSTLVEDIMTPAVFSVQPHTPAEKVIEQMMTQQVHRLFVVDATGALIGVISSMDIIRRLHREK